jgi:acetyl-CoA acetyltransferase
MGERDPLRDQIAIVGLSRTPYARDRGMSEGAMALEACIAAVRDAGLEARDIDGLCGSSVPAHYVAGGLRLPALTWWANLQIPFTSHVIEAANAIHAGLCDTVLAYHSTYRAGGTSSAAASDPFRVRAGPGPNVAARNPDWIRGAVGYAAWASRYLAEYGARREHLGYIAQSDRACAADNPRAVLRAPLSMQDYLEARMVREPLCLLDMDYPVDAADAFVLTRAERARDLPHRPVRIHAATLGMTGQPDEEQLPDLRHHGQHVVAANLWRKSELGLDDMDVFFPYDGFSIICLSWFEAVGYCGFGEAGPFVEAQREPATGRIRIGGRVPVNPHGGSLSEGGTQGSGHLHEAVLQLRGAAGARQAPAARTALLTPGGFFFNAGGLILRSD